MLKKVLESLLKTRDKTNLNNNNFLKAQQNSTTRATEKQTEAMQEYKNALDKTLQKIFEKVIQELDETITRNSCFLTHPSNQVNSSIV